MQVFDARKEVLKFLFEPKICEGLKVGGEEALL